MAQTTIFALCGAALTAAMPTQASTTLPARTAVATGQTAERHAMPSRAPILLAQSGDATVRLNRVEEEMRRLNGQVEELRFQLLQAQEDMRKRQEDNEFRFQQLEGGSASGSGGGGASSSPERRGDAGTSGDSGRSTASASSPSSSSSSSGQNVDDIGQLLNGGDLAAAGSNGSSGTGGGSRSSSDTVASIKPEGAGELYDLAYNYLLAGDYQLAEQSFRQYSQTYPKADDAPDARYWLGESLYQQQKYADAAEVFLDAQKDSPENAKAPEMMLKLGMSLAKLNNRDVACTTYKEVARRYPQMSANVKSKLSSEEKAANC